jgi:tRNA pseudouridine65 synthase
LQVLYQDSDLIAINKPTGVFVHRTSLDREATTFVIQEVRNILGHHVYPVHRLDRKTSGLLVLAKHKEAQSVMNAYFRDREVEKEYLAIVRGWTEDKGEIDYPLINDRGKSQDAITRYTTVERVEVDLPHGKFATSRYALVLLKPLTGRMHQLRRHMSHIFHPIIGDRPHGCNKQNRLFLEHYKMNDMLLHASKMTIDHPMTQKECVMTAPIFGSFAMMMDALGFASPIERLKMTTDV